MAKKRRRKPGLQRCSICGAFQLVQEMEARICLACLGLVGVKRWRTKAGACSRRPAAAEGRSRGPDHSDVDPVVGSAVRGIHPQERAPAFPSGPTFFE